MVIKLYSPSGRGRYITISIVEVFHSPAVLVAEWVGSTMVATRSLTPAGSRGAAEELKQRTAALYRAQRFTPVETPKSNLITLRT